MAYNVIHKKHAKHANNTYFMDYLKQLLFIYSFDFSMFTYSSTHPFSMLPPWEAKRDGELATASAHCAGVTAQEGGEAGIQPAQGYRQCSQSA